MSINMIDLKIGTKIQFDHKSVFSASTEPNWVDATVVDLLSTQFVAEHIERERPYTIILFYKNRNLTWKFK